MIERGLKDGVLTLRLAHGKASALDVELLDALVNELTSAGDDVRAVVLTGTGSIFSAGVDLFRLTSEGPEYVRRFLPQLHRFVRAFFGFPKPVVAAVNGHAIAGGCIIVLASDYRLMAEGNGRIGIPELLVGVPFPVAPLEVVRFAVPRNTVQSLIYTGVTLPPDEALKAGLIDGVVAPEKLLERAGEIALQLAAIPTAAFSLTKQRLRAEALRRMDSASEAHDQAALEAWSSEETRAHIQEYLRKTLRK